MFYSILYNGGEKKMKKNLSILLLASILIFLIIGTGFAFQNEPDGFRGLKWGDTPAEDMEIYGEYGIDGTLYERPSDKMEIWNVKFNFIIYRFYENKRFMEVAYFIRSKEYYDILEIFCREKYGKPTEEKYGESIPEIYYDLEWWGGKAWIDLHYNPIEKRGYLSITSRLIWEEREKVYKKMGLRKEKEKDDKQKEESEGKGIIILSGFGQEASEKFVLEKGLVRFNLIYKGQHNFIVWLLDNNGKEVELLVNTVGYFNGSKAIGIDETGIYLLDILADEYWTIIIDMD